MSFTPKGGHSALDKPRQQDRNKILTIAVSGLLIHATEAVSETQKNSASLRHMQPEKFQ
jgi:hypothetical protein